MQWITRIFDKTGALGAILAAMGCTSCFPALGALAASLGLGFLAPFEGLFINTLLPVFASLAMLSQAWLGVSRRQWLRLLVGVAGPAMVLATLYLFWSYSWSTLLFYAGLGLMFQLALVDAGLLFGRRVMCVTPGCDRRAS